jgi:hypothetical protein
MKKEISCILVTLTAVAVMAGDNMGIDKKYGTIKGRVQTISMWRDYDQSNPKSNYSHSLGLQLDYLSPDLAGFTLGASYSGVGVVDAGDINGANPGEARISNGRVNVLNEGYLQYRFSALNASNTTVVVGRKADNGEVFQYTEARQKKRSLEGLFIETKDISNMRIKMGHTWKLSNIYGTGDNWDFNDFGDVFGAGYDTEGVTWVETVYTGIENLNVSLFNAYAWDVANLIGTRAKYSLSDTTAIEASYRNEKDVGKAANHNADAFSLALIQKMGTVTLEAGYFGVHGAKGSKLHFEENTTGINHALGSSLMIATAHFAGGSDTAYLKATTKIKKTTLYGLLNATWHKNQAYAHAQELNLVVKQDVTDSFSVCFKGGIAQQQMGSGSDQNLMDARLFITYNF